MPPASISQPGSPRARIRVREVFGLEPLLPALRQMWLGLRGNDLLPAARWGVSSLKILKPWISLPTWAGRVRSDRLVPIYNLVNRKLAPRDQGYSVRVTHARDFRGTQLTYDSHTGTDFAVPVGTRVVAGAAGRVCRVAKEMQRGGLKVCIDHGAGLFTVSCHLARARVAPGDEVGRGEIIGLSGMSGVDGVLMFPWLSPHLHYTVVLDGETIDPFAMAGEEPLWRGSNRPTPHTGEADRAFEPTLFCGQGLRASIEACRDPRLQSRLSAIRDDYERGVAILWERVFTEPLFTSFPGLCAESHPRSPRLDLPFPAEDFDGIAFPG